MNSYVKYRTEPKRFRDGLGFRLGRVHLASLNMRIYLQSILRFPSSKTKIAQAILRISHQTTVETLYNPKLCIHQKPSINLNTKAELLRRSTSIVDCQLLN